MNKVQIQDFDSPFTENRGHCFFICSQEHTFFSTNSVFGFLMAKIQILLKSKVDENSNSAGKNTFNCFAGLQYFFLLPLSAR
jgi:hypothetical protein